MVAVLGVGGRRRAALAAAGSLLWAAVAGVAAAPESNAASAAVAQGRCIHTVIGGPHGPAVKHMMNLGVGVRAWAVGGGVGVRGVGA